ncbi:MAG: hypothetical protein M3P53_12560 [Actinomycetota bacterium]|nr:hypothetical protein [Actinomycetota bacterium]
MEPGVLDEVVASLGRLVTGSHLRDQPLGDMQLVRGCHQGNADGVEVAVKVFEGEGPVVVEADERVATHSSVAGPLTEGEQWFIELLERGELGLDVGDAHRVTARSA